MLSSHAPFSGTHVNDNYTAQKAQREYLVWFCYPKTCKFQRETDQTSTLISTPDSNLLALQVHVPHTELTGHITVGCCLI